MSFEFLFGAFCGLIMFYCLGIAAPRGLLFYYRSSKGYFRPWHVLVILGGFGLIALVLILGCFGVYDVNGPCNLYLQEHPEAIAIFMLPILFGGAAGIVALLYYTYSKPQRDKSAPILEGKKV